MSHYILGKLEVLGLVSLVFSSIRDHRREYYVQLCPSSIFSNILDIVHDPNEPIYNVLSSLSWTQTEHHNYKLYHIQLPIYLF